MIRRSATAVFSLSLFIVALTPFSAPSAGDTPNDTVRAWTAWEEKHDLKGIRFSPEMRRDDSRALLAVPEELRGADWFDVASEPPAVDFSIVQGYEPWYLPVIYYDDYRRGGVWEGYGDVTKGPDGRYYYSIGDHRSFGANAYIFRYDPVTKRNDIVVDLKKVMGWGDDVFADGKIHGDLDIAPDGDMWFLTYFGPMPTEKEWSTAYRGSWLLRHNIFSGETECLGIPLEGSSWPYYNFDYERGLFFGVAEHDGVVIAFDTRERRMVYGGAPKHGISWHRRCTMLDHDTGMFYSTDTVTYAEGERYRGEQYIVSWERRNNVFTRMKSKVPVNPALGAAGPLRAHTSEKDREGAFWCFSENGVMFRFFPAADSVRYIGPNWGTDGEYITNMSFSPGRRYIYYIARGTGTPVIQYDTRTGRRKVLAFLGGYYRETYGYCTDRAYGLELDPEGASIVFYMCGGFGEGPDVTKYRRPALFHLHIPESERRE